MSLLASRKAFLWVLLGLVLLTVPFLRAGPRRITAASAAPLAAALPPTAPLSPPLLSSQILEVHSASLTSYLAGASPVQDVLPRADQRAVGIDGSQRAGSALIQHIAGNPFGPAFGANQSLGSVSLVTGGYATSDIDMALPAEGGGRWVIGRTYNSRQSSFNTSYQGEGWHQMSQPELVPYNFDASGDFENTQETEDMLYLVFGADRYVEFDRDADNSDEFKAKNGAAGGILFVEDATGPDTYVLTTQNGFEYTFFGFDDDSDPATGQLWKIVDPDDNVAFVGYETDKDIAIHGQGSPAIEAGYDASGRIKYAFDGAGRRYTYTYTVQDSVTRLTQVKAETKTGGTWYVSPTGVTDPPPLWWTRG